MIRKFTKKPITIEAVQLTADNRHEVHSWINSFGETNSTLSDGGGLFISTLEGTMTAAVGDYVIRGIKGEFYPCKPDIFEASYNQTQEPQNPFEFTTDDELIEELARRTDGMVFISSKIRTNDESEFNFVWRKGFEMAYGLMKRATVRLDHESLKAIKAQE